MIKKLLIIPGLFVLLSFYFLRPLSLLRHFLTPLDKMSWTDQEVYKEAKLETTKLINLYGYPAENHTVITHDGYILTMHRIPYGKHEKSHSGMPIFLQHGFSGKSTAWLSNMDNSIGFKLADEGFDVWLGNFRGNKYSRQHKSLNIDSKKYWHFGWDKFVRYDIPAMIDYIRNQSGHDKVLTMGHSLGALSLFCASASQPEFNQRVSGIVALGPGAHAKYCPSHILLFKTLIVKYGRIVKSIFGKGYFPHDEEFEDLMLRLFLTMPVNFSRLPIDLLAGLNPYSFQNKTRFPVQVNAHLGGTSAHVFYHLNELEYSTKIPGYNYGREQNFKEYYQTIPIEYDLTGVNVPVAIMHSANDVLGSTIDVALMIRELPNLIASEMLTSKLAAHLDYFFLEKDDLIFKSILNWLEQMKNM